METCYTNLANAIILDGAFFNWLEENLDVLLRLDGPAMAY